MRGMGRENAPVRTWLPALGILVVGLLLHAPAALANGGTLRVANVEVGAYRVSVFTDPTPVRPDTLDVSVLVTRADDGGLAEGVRVRVRASSLDEPLPGRELEATREAADDPRYFAAKFSLGEAGRWRITVEVEGPEGAGEATFDLRARNWGILANPLFVLLLSLLPLAAFTWWLLRRGEEDEGVSRPPPSPRDGRREDPGGA